MNINSKSIRKEIGKKAARLTVYLFSLSLAFSTPYSFSQPGSQQEENLAGHIIMVSGDVFARDSSGDDRELRRRSAIFEGDVIITAAAATTQIRMVDEAIIALKESTEFTIVAYQYEQNPVSDISSIELIEGGFRTITGAIGRQNREAYEASIANFATIGIRGTDYEVVITPVGEVITGVYDGGTRVSNDAGELDLGFGAQYDFALVPGPDTPPQGLTLQPEGIGSIPLALLDQDDDDDDGGDDDNGNTANDDNQNDGNNGNGNDDNDADGGGADNAAVPNVPAATNNDDSGDDDSDNSLNLAPPAAAVLADTPAADTANNAVNEERETSQSALSVNPNETTGDGSVACSNATTSCLQANGDDPTDNGNGNGNGNSGDDNDNGNGNSGNNDDNNGNSGDNGNAGGNSDNSNAGGNSDDGNDSDNGNSGDNGNAGGNSDNSNAGGNSDDGDGSDNGNSGDTGNAGGNSDNNNAGGNSDDDNDSDNENSGDNGNAGGNSDNSNAGGNSDDGDDGADNGKPEDNPSAKGSLQDFVDTLRNRGFLDEEDDEDEDEDEKDDSDKGNNGNGNSDKDKDKDNNGNGKDKSSLTTTPASSVESSTITWDRWDEPLDQNWVAVARVDDDLVRISTSNYFALVNATPVANMQGSHSYATGIASSFIGSGSAGDISSLTAGMDVNFDTGAISNGSLQVQVADQAWSVDFSGAVMNGAVDLNALGGQLIDNTGIISNSIEANLGGVFSGNSAEAFVGGFDLLDSVNTLNSVNGLYSIER